jgi:hypothetical protein
MSNSNLNRLSQDQPRLRLVPYVPFPETHLKRFPELREMQAQNDEIWKRNEEILAQQIAIAQAARTG